MNSPTGKQKEVFYEAEIHYDRIYVFLLGGCRSMATTSIPFAKEMVGDGFPNEYYEGVAAGCDSGLNSVRYYRFNYYFSHRKDNEAYQSNKNYSSGWERGKNQCVKDGLRWKKEERQLIQKIAAEKFLFEQNK